MIRAFLALLVAALLAGCGPGGRISIGGGGASDGWRPGDARGEPEWIEYGRKNPR